MIIGMLYVQNKNTFNMKHNNTLQQTVVFYLMMLLSPPTFGQDIKKEGIIGQVENGQGEPLTFVNVVELSEADSSFIKGTVSKDDGTFALEDVKMGNILRFSSIGYKTQYVNYTGQTSINIRLAESAELLGEVVVKSQLPKTTLNGEGMTTVVAGSVLEKTANMEQLLSRVPSVSARNGDIVVFGRGTPEIYINGRKMRDNMELRP